MDDKNKRDQDQREEPTLPNPEDITQRPEVDLSNEVKKGGEEPSEKRNSN